MMQKQPWWLVVVVRVRAVMMWMEVCSFDRAERTFDSPPPPPLSGCPHPSIASALPAPAPALVDSCETCQSPAMDTMAMHARGCDQFTTVCMAIEKHR